MTKNTQTASQLLFDKLAIDLSEVPFKQLSHYTAVEYFLTVEDEPSSDAISSEKVNRHLQSIHHLAACQALKQIKIIFATYINISKTAKTYSISLDNYLLFQGLFVSLLKSIQEVIDNDESNNIDDILILKGKALSWNGFSKESCALYEQIISKYSHKSKIDLEIYIETVARLGIEQIRSGRKSSNHNINSGIGNLRIALEKIDILINKQSNIYLIDLKTDILESLAFYEKSNGKFFKSFKLYSETVKLRKKYLLNHKISFPLGHKGIVVRNLYNSPFYQFKLHFDCLSLWIISYNEYSLTKLIARKKKKIYKKCLIFLHKAIDLAESFGIEKAWINHHIAITHLTFGKANLAEAYNKLALKYYENAEAQKGIADCLDLQVFIDLTKKSCDINEVRRNCDKSLNIRKNGRTESMHGIFNSKFSLSIVLWHEEKIIRSIKQLIKSLFLLVQLPNSFLGIIKEILKRIVKFCAWTILLKQIAK